MPHFLPVFHHQTGDLVDKTFSFADCDMVFAGWFAENNAFKFVRKMTRNNWE